MAGAARNAVEEHQGRGELMAEPVQRAVDVVPVDLEGRGALQQRVEGAAGHRLIHGDVQAKLGDIGEELVAEVAEEELARALAAGSSDVLVVLRSFAFLPAGWGRFAVATPFADPEAPAGGSPVDDRDAALAARSPQQRFGVRESGGGGEVGWFLAVGAEIRLRQRHAGWAGFSGAVSGAADETEDRDDIGAGLSLFQLAGTADVAGLELDQVSAERAAV